MKAGVTSFNKSNLKKDYNHRQVQACCESGGRGEVEEGRGRKITGEKRLL